MTKTKINTLQDVVYLRCLAVISLVAWHSYCSYVCWGYGNSPLDRAYSMLFSFLTPDANMPLFTFMAGYLFCFLLMEKRKYGEFKPFLKNKVHRLLIPFLVWGALTNLTEVNRSILEMVYGKPSHLWYCLMLFYCYNACWLIEKLGSKYNVAAMGLSALIVIAKGKGALNPNIPLGLFLPMYYYCYFYLGFVLFKHKDMFLRYMKKGWMLFVALAYVGLSVLDKSHLVLFHSVTYIALILAVFNLGGGNPETSEKKCRWQTIINSISKCSMGIYVFHQWIIWNITRSEFSHNFIHEHYVMFPLLCWIGTFCFSWALTHLFAKYTKVGRYLLM